VPFRYPAQVMGLCEQANIKHLCAVEIEGAAKEAAP
jgi:hypothetical protein